MKKPVYTNEFDKPVFAVNNAHIRKVNDSQTLYELQLNDQYFQISNDMLQTLASATELPGNIGLSIG